MSVTHCFIKTLIGMLMLLFVQEVLSQTTVRVLPATREVLLGETVALNVYIATTDSLHAYQVRMRFDNAILQIIGVTEGSYLKSGPFGTFFTSYPAPSPDTDSITVTQAILGPDAISGTGELFSLTFKAVGTGVTTIVPEAATLFKGDGVSTFAADVQSSEVTVRTPLPVQLTSFTGKALPLNRVQLEWATLSEVNNYGFYVERQRENESSYRGLPNSFVPGHGTTLSLQRYFFTDEGVEPGRWHYRLRQLDLDGAVHNSWAIEVQMSAEVKVLSGIAKFSLMQNYPNPFNPRTSIAFTLPTDGHVSLDVYNLLGEHVVTLLTTPLGVGRHAVEWDASNFPSGVYIYRLTTNSFIQARKLIVAK